MRKSNISELLIVVAMSERCSVLRLLRLVCISALKVMSMMNSSHALANRIGASAEIIFVI